MHFSAVPAANGHAMISVDDRRSPRPALVVFSSPRWGFDYQRPQHLLTRIAKHYRVFFVEEPVSTHQDARLASSHPAPGI